MKDPNSNSVGLLKLGSLTQTPSPISTNILIKIVKFDSYSRSFFLNI